MKQLYIRKGNLESNQNILIIGEEAELGSRDSAYKAKGTLHDRFLASRDPYSGSENLIYIHACRNILLNSETFTRDYDIHRYLKTYCKDLLKWDGEANQGVTDSREAFIVRNGDVKETVKIIRERIASLVEPETLLQTLRSSSIYHRTLKKSKKYRVRKAYKNKFKIKVFIGLFILCVLFRAISSFVSDFQAGIYDTTYDYRYKMSDENDKWLLNKCQQIIGQNGGTENWGTEAYYSNRFSEYTNYKEHFYDDYTVIRIKTGLTVQQEQKSIQDACNDVIKHHKN